jgi:hypothetical protein
MLLPLPLLLVPTLSMLLQGSMWLRTWPTGRLKR